MHAWSIALKMCLCNYDQFRCEIAQKSRCFKMLPKMLHNDRYVKYYEIMKFSNNRDLIARYIFAFLRKITRIRIHKSEILFFNLSKICVFPSYFSVFSCAILLITIMTHKFRGLENVKPRYHVNPVWVTYNF